MKKINGRNAVQKRIQVLMGSDNNVNLLYFAVNSINYITLNMFPTEFRDAYDNFLREMSFTCKDVKPTHDKRHERLRQYEHTHLIAYDGKPLRVDLLLYPQKYKATGITTTIYYPTKTILDLFVQFFSETHMPQISFLELTFDSFTEQPKVLAELLETYLLMSRNRLEPNKVKDTSYQTNEVKSKGMRLYIKEEMFPIPVRVELMLRRVTIKKLGLELETLDQILRKIDFSDFFGFKRLDKGKYTKRQDERLRQKFKEDRRRNNRIERKSWGLEDSHALQERIKNNAVDNLLTDVDGNGPRSIAQINSLLRMGENRRQDFYENFQEMNDVFFSGINYRSFLE